MMRGEEQQTEASGLRAFAANWLTVDNLSLIVAIALITAGAACWSARAALVTCGSLVLGVTFLRMHFDGTPR